MITFILISPGKKNMKYQWIFFLDISLKSIWIVLHWQVSLFWLKIIKRISSKAKKMKKKVLTNDYALWELVSTLISYKVDIKFGYYANNKISFKKKLKLVRWFRLRYRNEVLISYSIFQVSLCNIRAINIIIKESN